MSAQCTQTFWTDLKTVRLLQKRCGMLLESSRIHKAEGEGCKIPLLCCRAQHMIEHVLLQLKMLPSATRQTAVGRERQWRHAACCC